jgi:hypothetical protein
MNDVRDFLGDLGEEPAAAPTAAPAPVDLPPALLALFFCDDVLASLAYRSPAVSVIGLRYLFVVPGLPATVDTGLAVAVWRLPPGAYRLDVGLLAADDRLLAVDTAGCELTTATVYTSLHRLGRVTFPAAGLYRLSARQNEQVMAFQPVEVALAAAPEV